MSPYLMPDVLTVKRRAIENGFPLAFVSRLAEHESWRKEVYRPMNYLHKWWARRLGSVFRAILIASCADGLEDVETLFYQPTRFPKVTVFDPFMGSGTTIHEAVKLGCRVIGRDINPVSHLMVSAALQAYTRSEVQATFQHLSDTVGATIRSFYTCQLSSGQNAEVLYNFWVKTVPCPACGSTVELFKSRIFAKNASPRKHPEAKALCPHCHTINDVRHDAVSATCSNCRHTYNPQLGTVIERKAHCLACHQAFPVIEAVRKLDSPPSHKLYAKMVLCDNDKVYLPADAADMALYQSAQQRLPELGAYIPQTQISPGYNTNQVLNYNYRFWHELFNARQLACFGMLVSEIKAIPKPELRTLFACLLSSVLEFNNLFCSFKGEGTGAVRPIFSHHILKPELAPLEANIWGTPKSSGSFSTLFESRLLRVLDYKDTPYEFRLAQTNNGKRTNRKTFGLSQPLNKILVSDCQLLNPHSVYLSCGDSAKSDLPDASVDVVVTDPPFFDNVHYSQLADFFYVWLRQILDASPTTAHVTTRSLDEVQDTEAGRFADKLTAVFRECYRVLKPDGLLVFTYHHSRAEGWLAVYQAIRQAGFYISQAHPVKAEMAVAIPIQQSKTPINFDLIFVCRKIEPTKSSAAQEFHLLTCLIRAKRDLTALRQASLVISIGDVKVILLGHVLAALSQLNDWPRELTRLQDLQQRADSLAEEVLKQTYPEITPQQFTLFDSPQPGNGRNHD